MDRKQDNSNICSKTTHKKWKETAKNRVTKIGSIWEFGSQKLAGHLPFGNLAGLLDSQRMRTVANGRIDKIVAILVTGPFEPKYTCTLKLILSLLCRMMGISKCLHLVVPILRQSMPVLYLCLRGCYSSGE